MSNRKVIILIVGVFVTILILGYYLNTIKKDVAVSVSEDKIKELENKIVLLEQVAVNQQVTIEEQLARLTELESLNGQIEILDESNLYIQNRLFVLDSLVQHTTSSKTAMLNGAKIQDQTLELTLTYLNIVEDNDAPNNYHLVGTEQGTKTIKVSSDVPIYLLESPGSSIEATWEQIVEHRGFFQLFEKDGEVVFVVELYLP